jgi:UDP-3-O-[3-hydroxymyristoyl] glucosamine N-acyltransferase
MGESYTVEALTEALGATFEGDGSVEVTGLVHPLMAAPDKIVMASSADFLALIERGTARVALVSEGADWRAVGLDAAIVAPRPRYAMAHATRAFAMEDALGPGIHPSAVIETGADIGEGARIGPFVHIAARATIGRDSRIMAHVSIGEDAVLGEGALVHSGARIASRVRIGERAIIHQNAVIGADGFSFVTPDRGAVEAAKAGGGSESGTQNLALTRIHSLAAVTLGDDVEIGACTTIDRGTLRDTRIGNGTKLDNQVQIGHNVTIGGTCMLCAQVGVAGSSEIGDRVVLGGKAGVADHVKIGSDVLVAAASAVASNVKGRSIVMGVPAVPRDEAVRSVMAIRRLPRLMDTVAELKKAIMNGQR